jgi:hypothetical protein
MKKAILGIVILSVGVFLYSGSLMAQERKSGQPEDMAASPASNFLEQVAKTIREFFGVEVPIKPTEFGAKVKPTDPVTSLPVKEGPESATPGLETTPPTDIKVEPNEPIASFPVDTVPEATPKSLEEKRP